ncbi:nucleotidyltransferase domain-containing protein [Marinomonas polaris]|uniref:nucleotidyltransferase domain-containing protein n=1 Tax=Marinomonas polaris TaxID=293552 RepID=UPI00351975FE
MFDMGGLSRAECGSINGVFQLYPQIKTVILYGSRAKGNFRPSSDIDLTLVGDLDWSIFTEVENALDDLLLPYKIDLSMFDHLENNQLIEHIERVGLVFYSRK